MPKLQIIERKDGTSVGMIYLPKKALNALNAEKGDFLKCEAKENQLIISK